MDALKDRIRAFTESISIMTCPVLVAVALKKADLMNEGNSAVRHSVSPLAAISLCLCSSAFIVLSIASSLKHWLPKERFDRLSLYAYISSKVLVYLCVIAQMLMAFMIFLLIGMRFKVYMTLLIIAILFLCQLLYMSMKSEEDISRNHNNNSWDKKLAPSLDFSAAVTSLLFLGLEGLALEGQIGVGKDLNSGLLGVLPLTYCICVVASTVMFLAAVPPIDYEDETSCERLYNTLHFLCGLLTIFIVILVLAIAYLLEKEAGVLVPSVPILCLLLFYAVLVCDVNNQQPAVDDPADRHKPAPLELAKVTFTVFLAVSLPSFGDDQISRSTHVFIVSTAMSVLFGLAWRLLTHFNQKAAFKTAAVACVATHGCLAVAVISLASMGMQALAEASDEECHFACNSTQSNQLQLHLFATCFTEKANKAANSYTLSSVRCN